jgi:hypothetical protein
MPAVPPSFAAASTPDERIPIQLYIRVHFLGRVIAHQLFTVTDVSGKRQHCGAGASGSARVNIEAVALQGKCVRKRKSQPCRAIGSTLGSSQRDSHWSILSRTWRDMVYVEREYHIETHSVLSYILALALLWRHMIQLRRLTASSSCFLVLVCHIERMVQQRGCIIACVGLSTAK